MFMDKDFPPKLKMLPESVTETRIKQIVSKIKVTVEKAPVRLDTGIICVTMSIQSLRREQKMLYQIIAFSNADGTVKFNRLFTNKVQAENYGTMLWKNQDVYIEFSEIEKDIDGAFNVQDIKQH